MEWVYAWVPESEIDRVMEDPKREGPDPVKAQELKEAKEAKEAKEIKEAKEPNKPKAGVWEPKPTWEDDSDSWGTWQPHVDKSSKNVGPYAGDPKEAEGWWKNAGSGPRGSRDSWERPPMKPASKPLPRRRVWQMEMIEDGGKVDSE